MNTRGDTAALYQTPEQIRAYLKQPVNDRVPVGYNQDFLFDYQPNETFYFTEPERARLHEIGSSSFASDAPGAYTMSILDGLIVDLAYNSSRLEGNSYTLEETEMLVANGLPATSRTDSETQMIANHKEAIGFLAETAEAVGFNRRTVLNLHSILANKLLPNSDNEGRLRDFRVAIGGSQYAPVDIPQVVDDCFNRILDTASEIEDPFEQAFFSLVHLPYLQPFEDVNKRTSRLAANMPLIKANLAPLTFVGVAVDEYQNGILGVYELNQVSLLKKIFCDSYALGSAV